MRVIICGGRDYELTDADMAALDALHGASPFSQVVCGGASGADTGGRWWAAKRKIGCAVYTADWKQFGRAAGPMRNQEMAMNADAIVIFPGGRGTRDMKVRAQKAGLRVLFDATI